MTKNTYLGCLKQNRLNKLRLGLNNATDLHLFLPFPELCSDLKKCGTNAVIVESVINKDECTCSCPDGYVGDPFFQCDSKNILVDIIIGLKDFVLVIDNWDLQRQGPIPDPYNP